MKFGSLITYISALILIVFAVHEALLAIFIAPGMSSGMNPVKVSVLLHVIAGGLFLATSYRQIVRPRLALLTLAIFFMIIASLVDSWALYIALNDSSFVEAKNQVDSAVQSAIKDGSMSKIEEQFFGEILNEPKVSIKEFVFSIVFSLVILSLPIYSNFSRTRHNKNS